MLQLAKSLGELRFGELMELYVQDNLEHGRELWPDEPEERRIMLSEQAFYAYLRDDFFKTPGAVYALWEAYGQYVSALRLETHRAGLLLEALTTREDQRQKGYATALIRAVLESRAGEKIYSHVNKHNIPSLKTHENCGFQIISDHAVYLDGSVNDRSYTLCHMG